MALIQVKCNNCGANIQIDDSREKAFCSYCGAQYHYERPVSVHIENINIGTIPAPNRTSNFGFNLQEYAMPFKQTEAQAKHKWLTYIMSFEDAPLDVAYKAKILSITKRYYPIAFFDVTCTADWNALSFWEHDEPYQVVEKHRTLSGEVEHRVVTKHRTIVDTVQQTNGSVYPTTHTVKVSMGPNYNTQLGDEILSWIDLDTKCVEVKDDFLSHYSVYPQDRKRDEAIKVAEEYAHNEMQYIAQGQVPGDRYENLNVTSYVENNFMTIRYVAVYEIKYEYSGSEFLYYMLGSADSKVWAENHPTDKYIRSKVLELRGRVESIKKWPWIFALIFSPLPLYAFGSSFASVSSSDIGRTISWVIMFAIYAFFIFMLVFNITRKSNATEKLNTYNTKNTRLKNKIHKLLQDDSISDESKSETIEKLIKENALELDSILNNTSSKSISGGKIGLIIGICITVLIVGLSVSHFIPRKDNSQTEETEETVSTKTYSQLRSEASTTTDSTTSSSSETSRTTDSTTSSSLIDDNITTQYTTQDFDGFSFEIPSDSRIQYLDNVQNDSFSSSMGIGFPSDSSGILMYSYSLDSFDTEVDASTEEYFVRFMLQRYLEDQGATNIQRFSSRVDSMIAEGAFCYLGSMTTKAYMFCSKDYSKLYLVLYQVYNTAKFTPVDEESFNHMIDSIIFDDE